MPSLAFEWDGKKDATNRRKHRVGFAEASTVFDDLLSMTIQTRIMRSPKIGL
jgi:uncharacterized DUF497 family protein